MDKYRMIKSAKARRKPQIDGNHFLNSPYYFVMVALVVIPLLVMILYSVQVESSNGLLKSQFSISHYQNFLSDFGNLRAIWRSVWLAFLSTVLALLIGYPVAYIISKQKLETQTLLILLITGTMWINMVLRIYAMQQIFTMISSWLPFLRPYLIQSDTASLIGMVYIYLPYMILPIYTVLAKLDSSYLESAADLGADSRHTFLKVVVPLSLPGVISGITMVFLPAVTTIIVPGFLGNTTQLMIGQLIENKAIIEAGNQGINYAASIAVVLAIVMILAVYLIKKIDRYPSGGEIDD